MFDFIALERELSGREAYWTLAPGRVRARLHTELCDRLLLDSDSVPLKEAFIEGLVQAMNAMLSAFPDNLLWDLEGLAARQLQQARLAADPAATLSLLWSRVAQLQHVFGRGGPIRFRYIHDFVYGFDWARWVAKDPDARQHVGPYDSAFVERMHRRGADLLELIAAGDPKYGPLAGPQSRNPFGFSRSPTDELALHRRLAEQDALPVRAWDRAAKPQWQRPYARLRDEAALALRISA
ncbi:MAG: ferrochelatase [Nannocystaceae bacterium]|nr:ferrochelatase [Nannocystaceae bacterium]